MEIYKTKREDNIGISPMKSKGHLVTDSVERTKLLVDQFQSVFTKNDKKPLPNVSRRDKENIPTLNIGEKGVRKLLQNIKINKAVGPDELPNRVLQGCSNEAAPAITAIFNIIIFQLSIDFGELPKDWRKANIAPVFKKADRHLPENYRRVSLTCVLS